MHWPSLIITKIVFIIIVFTFYWLFVFLIAVQPWIYNSFYQTCKLMTFYRNSIQNFNYMKYFTYVFTFSFDIDGEQIAIVFNFCSMLFLLSAVICLLWRRLRMYLDMNDIKRRFNLIHIQRNQNPIVQLFFALAVYSCIHSYILCCH